MQTDLFIRHFSFWEHLTEAQKELLCSHVRTVRYDAGETIHRGALDCIGVLLVKRGQLRLYTLSEDGRDVTLYRLFPDDVGVLSASCAMEAVTFDVFMDAEEDTEVLLLESGAFRKLAGENIHVKCYGYEMASGRLSEMLWKLQQILFLSADRRLAMFLLEESGKTGTAEIRLTHEQVARFMGSAREVVSRLVKYFAQEGLVRPGRGCLTILDRAGLERLAGE